MKSSASEALLKKVNSRCFKLNRAIPTCSIRQLLAKFSGLIPKDCIKVEEKKKKVVVSCSHP